MSGISAIDRDVALFEKRGLQTLLTSMERQVNEAQAEKAQAMALLHVLIVKAGGEVRIPRDLVMEIPAGRLEFFADELTGELVYRVVEANTANA